MNKLLLAVLLTMSMSAYAQPQVVIYVDQTIKDCSVEVGGLRLWHEQEMAEMERKRVIWYELYYETAEELADLRRKTGEY